MAKGVECHGRLPHPVVEVGLSNRSKASRTMHLQKLQIRPQPTTGWRGRRCPSRPSTCSRGKMHTIVDGLAHVPFFPSACLTRRRAE